jgi:2-keto-3-deoxy-L-arabinonate dehydratase
MQSLETLICYGKRLFAARAGLTVHDRGPALRPTEFGLSLVARHAEVLGPFGARAAGRQAGMANE